MKFNVKEFEFKEITYDTIKTFVARSKFDTFKFRFVQYENGNFAYYCIDTGNIIGVDDIKTLDDMKSFMQGIIQNHIEEYLNSIIEELCDEY